MNYKYKILLKDGITVPVEVRYVDPFSLLRELDDKSCFIKLGEKIFAKDMIVAIDLIEKTKDEE